MRSLDPALLSTRQRRVLAAIVHRVWRWAEVVGGVSPDDKASRRYAAFGARSCLAFPPGTVFGEEHVAIGRDTMIGPFVSLSVGLVPDEPTDFGPGPVIVIGDRVNIGRGSSIIGRQSIVIGDDVTTAPNVYITDHNHVYADPNVPVTRQWPAEAPVRIGAGSWIGAGAVILPGATLGRNVVVGAGAVVRGDVADHAVVGGVPAKVIRRLTDDGEWDPPLPPLDIRPPADWRPR